MDSKYLFLVYGVFIGGLGVLFLMSILKSGSDADDRMLGDRQYDED